MRARPRRVQKLPGVLALRVILRRNPWAPLAGSLRAGQARGLRSQARFAQGRPVGTARRLASRRAGDEASIQLRVATVGMPDPAQAHDDIQARTTREPMSSSRNSELS